MEVADAATKRTGSDLRATRARARLSQSELAEAMGVSRGYVQQLEDAAGVTERAAGRYLAAVQALALERVAQAARALAAVDVA